LGALLMFCATCPLAADALAADLTANTVAAFDRYVRAAEERMNGDVQHGPFLWADGLDAARRRAVESEARSGRVAVERLRTRDHGHAIDVPDGIVHHWVGLIFVPGATAAQVVALMQDYDRHASVFAPAIQRSKLLSREGNRFRFFLRFHMKKVISVTVNTEHEARFVALSPQRAYSMLHSTRAAEVEEAGTAAEKERPVGHDGGYLWRLNTYWRFDERDGGTWVQCESITLTRDIPFGFGWLVGPFVTSIPRESLAFTLGRIRQTLTRS
jgi:hypothetical protein